MTVTCVIFPLTSLNLHGKIQQLLLPAFHTHAMDAGLFSARLCRANWCYALALPYTQV